MSVEYFFADFGNPEARNGKAEMDPPTGRHHLFLHIGAQLCVALPSFSRYARIGYELTILRTPAMPAN